MASENDVLVANSTFSSLLASHFENMQHRGFIYSGWISGKKEYERFRESLKEAGILFSVRNSRACISRQRELAVKSGKPFQSVSNTKKPLRERVHFDSQGVAYMIDKVVYEDCKYGPQYWNNDASMMDLSPESSVYGFRTTMKAKQRKSGTKKRNCPAKMLIKEVRVFPDYRLISNKPNISEKKMILQRLKMDLSLNKEPFRTMCYYIEISTLEAHNHSIHLSPGLPSSVEQTPPEPQELHQIRDLLPRLQQLATSKSGNPALLQEFLQDLTTWHDRLQGGHFPGVEVEFVVQDCEVPIGS